MKRSIVAALIQDCHAKVQLAKMNVQIYINYPVGVGDHPNIMETIQGQLDVISQNKDRLRVLESEFSEFND
tara:strand:- start:273 stop:485 length:213 start_codon:yes stop_codon:yes gene_type:complete